ncbi:hypothetical protein FGIG_01396 [Fasciola gigantica]|uniref:Uncharacterized protein n=1 Tax=Fasciola gigantica TaxID=46835 RepID=A0A504YSV6_FASGI|nr:hypothetical protein FGIG_01396 [Fasciola gigantica]
MYAQHIAIISLVGIAFLCPQVQMSNLFCLNDVREDLCIIRIDRKAMYCEAHEICEQEGEKRGLRLFILGNSASKTVALFSDTGTVFTSFNAMLNRTTDLRAGWRVGDPGYAKFVTTKSDTTITMTHSFKQCTECRSFYFNQKNKEYMLSLYVDSLLPLKFSVSSGAWVRFGRPD